MMGWTLPASAQVVVTGSGIHQKADVASPCTVLSKEEMEKAGPRPDISEVLKTLPKVAPPPPPPKQNCPPPSQNPPLRVAPLPMSTFRQLGTEGDANGPQFAPAPGPPPGHSAVDLINHKDEPFERPETPGASEPETSEPQAPELRTFDIPKAPTGLRDRTNTPFGRFEHQVSDALTRLEAALGTSDVKTAKALLPQLQDLLKRAGQFSESINEVGGFGNVSRKEAADVQLDLLNAIYDANQFITFPVRVRSDHGTAQVKETPPTAEVPKLANSVGPNPQQRRLLDQTNAIRAYFGAKPLRWNDGLAAGALDQAKHIAEIKQLEHASKVGRGDIRENLLRIRAGSSPDEMIEVWGAEIRDLIPGVSVFPNSAIDGFWDHVAHLTQIIWPTTTEMGCAWVESDGWIYLVCRYSPGGNKDGKPVGLLSASNGQGAYKRRDHYCSKQQQIDDLFVLQQELLARDTDESTLTGHLYGDAIRAEIAHVKQATIDPCAPTVDTASIDLPVDVQPPKESTGMATTTSATMDNAQLGSEYSSSIKDASKVSSIASADHGATTFTGPLLFTTMNNNPKWLNPKGLEFGLDAVNAWASFQVGLQSCDFPRMDAALAKLEYYAQTAREHSAEEKSKGNMSLSQSYADMARQIDERVADAEDREDRLDNCRQPERG